MSAPAEAPGSRAARVRSEIRDTLARLAHLADLGDPREYAACFAEDALWEVSAGAELPIPPAALRGRDAILAGAIERRAAGVQGPGTFTAHAVSTTSVEIDGSRAVARSLFMFYTGLDGAPALAAVGRYTDVFAEQPDGAWLLAHRSITRE
ncbi:nuclear transport factor 2 family protein [Leucobacter luti]|uniref:nuclear transport factor 2 family protein n=1 Tax=Leucobacter luti TaxID=340320 RepID=UPI003D032320